MLEDVTGKLLPASHVFQMFIKAFVNHLTEELDKKDAPFEIDETRWVIAVSADLTETSEQILRSCAKQVRPCILNTKLLDIYFNNQIYKTLFVIYESWNTV